MVTAHGAFCDAFAAGGFLAVLRRDVGCVAWVRVRGGFDGAIGVVCFTALGGDFIAGAIGFGFGIAGVVVDGGDCGGDHGFECGDDIDGGDLFLFHASLADGACGFFVDGCVFWFARGGSIGSFVGMALPALADGFSGFDAGGGLGAGTFGFA